MPSIRSVESVLQELQSIFGLAIVVNVARISRYYVVNALFGYPRLSNRVQESRISITSIEFKAITVDIDISNRYFTTGKSITPLAVKLSTISTAGIIYYPIIYYFGTQVAGIRVHSDTSSTYQAIVRLEKDNLGGTRALRV